MTLLFRRLIFLLICLNFYPSFCIFCSSACHMLGYQRIFLVFFQFYFRNDSNFNIKLIVIFSWVERMSYLRILIKNTLNKIDVLPNSRKTFRRCLKVSKGLESLKNRIKISTKPLKVLSVYRSEEPSPAKPFFKFRTAQKGFVGKYETFRVSY